MFPLVETWDDQSASLLCAYSTIHRTIESFLINLLFINQKLNTNESTFSHNFMDIAKSLQLEWNERKIPTAVDWKKSLCKPTPISIKKKTQRYSRSSITIISGRNSAVSVGRRGSSESTSRSLSLDFFEKAPNSVLDNFLQTLVEIPDYTREDIDWNDEKYQEMHKLDDSHYMLHHNTVILLNTSIPSKAPSMRFKSPDDERLEQLMIARIENRDRVPLGLTPEQYIQFMEVRMEELAFKEAMETEKKIRAKALQLMKDQENKKVKSVVLAQLMVKVKQIQKFNEKRRKSTVRKRRNADAFVKLAAMGSASKAAASAAAAHHHRRSTNTAPPPAPSSLVAVEDEFGSTTSASSNRNRGPSLDTVKKTNSKEERDSLKRVSAASEGGGAGMLSVQAPNNGTRRSAVGRMAQLFLGAFLDDVPDDNSRTSNETISYAEQQQQQQFYNIEVSGSQDGQRRRPSSATSLAASPPRFTSLRRPSATPQPPAETDQQRNFSYVRGKSSVLGITMSQKEKEIIVQSAAALSEPVPVPLAIRGSVLSGVRENTSGIRGTVMGGGASGRSASVATGSGGKAGVTVPSFTFSVGNDDEDGSDFNDTPPKLAIDGPVGDDETLETVSQQPRNDFEDVQIASLSVAPRDTVTRSLVNLIFDDEEEIGKTIRSSVAIKGGSITSSGTMLQQEGDRLAGVDSEVDNDNLSDEDAASTNGRRSSIAPKDMFFSFGDYKLADAEPEVRLAGDEYEDDDDVYSNDDSSLGSSNVSSVHSDELESELGLDEKLADKSGKEQLKAQLEIDKMFRVRQSSMDRRGSSVSTNDHLAGCGSVSGTRRKSRLVSPGDHHHQHQRQQEQEDEEVGGRATTRRSVGSRRVSIVGGNIFTGRRASTLGSILQENPESVLQSRRGSVLQSATSSTTAHEESKHQQQHQNHQHHHHKKERKRSLVYDNSIFPSSSSFSFRLSVVKSTIDDTKKIRRESKSAESARSNVISSFGGDMKTESPDLSRINNLLLQLESVKARGKYEEEKDS